MEKNRVRIFESVNDLATFAMEWLIEKMKGYSEEKKFTVALSGGTTPKQIFEFLALQGQKSVDWNRFLFFWSDERCVSPESKESNYRMVRNSFFDKLEIPEEHIFRIHGEADPTEEAKRYSRVLQESVPMKHGFPRFDLILLGLGEDGHTASIFPGNTQLFESEHFCEAVKHPLTGQQRITLTGPVINHAADIVFLVTGSGKAEIVFKVLNAKDNKYPASMICPDYGRLTWLLDDEAGSGLL